MYLLIACFKWQPCYSCTGLHHQSLIFPLSDNFCVLSKVKYGKELFVFRDAMPVLVALFLAKIQGDRGSASAVDFPCTFTPQSLVSVSLPSSALIPV